jgi:hypothetical protein
VWFSVDQSAGKSLGEPVLGHGAGIGQLDQALWADCVVHRREPFHCRDKRSCRFNNWSSLRTTRVSPALLAASA